MVENVGRKLILIAVLLAASVALLLIPSKPIRMGLDLRGGTRLVYSLDPESLPELGAGEDLAALIQQTLVIIRQRVDPNGVREATIRSEGTDRVVIELPGAPELGGAKIEGALATDLAQGTTTLDLRPEDAALFPPAGGTVYLQDERINYTERADNVLRGLVRGASGTDVVFHPAGTTVSLASTDEIRTLIENLGSLQFLIEANAADLERTETDLQVERQRLDTWWAANSERPSVRLADFNRVPREAGGPHPKVRWFPRKVEGATEIPEIVRATALVVQDNPDWHFTGSGLEKVFQSVDTYMLPAVGFEFKAEDRADFADFTEEHVNRPMAIVLNDQIESSPVINERLPGSGVISGKYTPAQVRDMITVLRSGSLPIRLIPEADERVGPSLGADYVRRGELSGGIALVAVMAFMIAYYRRLGVYACIALACGLLMLLAGLVLINATLTLPGIAGIVLTVGMAVDANILIFDRIREELAKGRNVLQAAKNGFNLALSTIIDANLTTLITAIVLYEIGTGPVRGFAVTLSVGILATMFSAIVITRVLVHFQLERGKREFKMGGWLVGVNWKYIDKAKLAVPASLLTIIAGLALFASLPERSKYGIDFLGGWRVEVRTQEPRTADDIRELIAQAPGAFGKSAEVKNVGRTGGETQRFVITFKGESASDDIDTFETDIRKALGSVLQQNPVTLAEDPERGGWNVDLYFDESHPAGDVQSVLDGVFDTVEVAVDPADPTRFRATASGSAGADRLALESTLQQAFSGVRDSAGQVYNLSLPLPSTSLVGPQVVGELRDKALLAIFVSLFATIMYIRVRFAEYSYGFAAVIAVFHDVLVTLGACAVAIATGFVHVEIDLTMIAAFLTIIGYSLNDTIVIFDRVRENLPRMQDKSMSEIMDISINQTMSRTILTSGTVLIASAILFLGNYGTSNALEGFSFAMVVGVITGSYSTIWIATPALVWLEEHRRKRDQAAPPGATRKPDAARATT